MSRDEVVDTIAVREFESTWCEAQERYFVVPAGLLRASQTSSGTCSESSSRQREAEQSDEGFCLALFQSSCSQHRL